MHMGALPAFMSVHFMHAVPMEARRSASDSPGAETYGRAARSAVNQRTFPPALTAAFYKAGFCQLCLL